MVRWDEAEHSEGDELLAVVRDELGALRSGHGRLTVQKFSQFPALRRVCGGGDLLDAFLTFERDLRRYVTTGNRDEVAAALSISALGDSVLDRLEEVANHFEEVRQGRDQRTARRWSDRGLGRIAADLVHVADIRGHLGVELMTVEIEGTRQTGLHVLVSHLTTKDVDEHSPLVRVWKNVGDDVVERSDRVTVDLDHVEGLEATNEMFRLKRHRVRVVLPDDIGEDDVDPGDALFSVSFEGRDAPMRTVSFVDGSDLGEGLGLRFTNYRTIVVVEVIKRSRES